MRPEGAAAYALGSLLALGCGRIGFDPDRAVADDAADAADAADAPSLDGVMLDAAGYRAGAVRFESSGGDYMWTGSLAGTTNSPRGTYSAWFHFNGGDDQMQLSSVAQVIGVGGVIRTASNRFRIVLHNCVGLPLLDMQTVGTYTSVSGWVHLLASWDVSAGRAQLYVNGVADRAASPTIINDNICYASLKWGIGGLVNGQLDADVADLYAVLGTSIDLDVEANRRLFRDAAGKPTELGDQCERPTGAPASGCFIGEASTWNTNRGTAAGFTLEGDGLAPAPTSPSD